MKRSSANWSTGEQAAAYLNQEIGADYKAIPSDREPADVLFVSGTKQLRERMVQVVTIQHDYQIRADNQNLMRFVRDLTAALSARGVLNLVVGFTALSAASKTGVPRDQVESLADHLAAAHQSQPHQAMREISFMELLTVAPELSAYLSNVVLCC